MLSVMITNTVRYIVNVTTVIILLLILYPHLVTLHFLFAVTLIYLCTAYLLTYGIFHFY